MFLPQQIGKYKISKALGPSQNSLCFRVHKDDKFYPFFTAEVYNLRTQLNLKQIIDIVDRKTVWIEEMFTICKNQRDYLIVVYNGRRVLASSEVIQKVVVTAQNCRKLMVEALTFVKELHGLGVQLKQTFTKFVQIQHYKSTVNLSIIKFYHIQETQNTTKNEQYNEGLKEKECFYLIWFYKYLSTIIRPKEKRNNIVKIVEDLQAQFETVYRSQLSQKQISIDEIMKRICQFFIKQDSFSFLCSLKPHKNNELYLQYHDLISNKITNFSTTQPIKVNKFRLIPPQVLFYDLAAASLLQILVISDSVVEFVIDGDRKRIEFGVGKYKPKEQEEQIVENSISELQEVWDKQTQEKEMQSKLISSQSKQQQQLIPFEFPKQSPPFDLAKLPQTHLQKSNPKKPQPPLRYPYNSIVQLKSIFAYNGCNIEVNSRGTLISKNLVLSCAQSLYFKYSIFPRKQASEVQIHIPNIGWQIRQKNCWKIPEKYRQTERRLYDFALIKLTNQVQKRGRREFIHLAYDYKEFDRVQLPKLKLIGQEIELDIQEATIDLGEKSTKKGVKGVMKHRMVTEKGDSGSPLIVQPQGMMGLCYVVGMHCSGKYTKDGFKTRKVNKAVRITKKVIEELANFQKILSRSPYSLLQEQSLNFDKIKNRPQQHQFKLEQIKLRVENNFNNLSQMAEKRLKDISSHFKPTQATFNFPFDSIHPYDIVQNQNNYPYNNLVQLKTIVKLPKNTYEVRGKGVLLTRQLVLTCAHNLYSRYEDQSAVRENWVWVVEHGWIKLPPHSFIIPQEYYDRQKQQYDFALMRLPKLVNERRFVGLGLNINSSMQVKLPKISLQNDKELDIRVQTRFIKIQEFPMIQHNFETFKGDSGTPLLIQPQNFIGKWYIVAIHTKDRYRYVYGDKEIKDNNKGVRITKIVYERLLYFEKILMMEKNKGKEEQNYEFESLIAKSVLNYQDFDKNKPVQQSRISTKDNNIANLLEGAQQYISLQNKLRILRRSIFYEDRHNSQLKDSQNLRRLKRLFQKYCIASQQNTLFDSLKKIIYTLYQTPKTLTVSANQKTSQQILELMQKFELEWGQLNWDVFAIEMSQQMKQKYNYFSSNENRAESNYIGQKLHQLVGLQFRNQPNNQTDIINRLIMIEKRFEPVECEDSEVDQGFYPFPEVRKIRYFSKPKVYEYELTVKFPCRKLRNKTFWQMIRLNHSSFYLLPWSRLKGTEEGTQFELKTHIVKLKELKTIKQCIGTGILSIMGWLEVMLQMTKFISYLHAQGLSLSVPIENCMYINVKDKHYAEPVFFYLQPYEIFRIHCSSIPSKQPDSNFTFPPIEITQDISLSKIQKIDVWMLGHIFKKIVATWTGEQILQEIKKSTEKLVKCMLTKPQVRFGIRRVAEYMQIYRDQLYKRICNYMDRY